MSILHINLLFALAIIFFALRIYPIWPRRFQGCDAYNILLNAECLRQRKRLPIRVPPLFMLEEQDQWYPPGFLILCSLIPPKWLQRRYWLLNHVVDLGSAVLIYAGALWLGAGLGAAVAATIVYALSAGLVREFSSLNVRPFGLLLFNALMLSGFAASHDPAWLPAAALLSIMLFFSHKLSMQQLWFSMPVLSLVTGEWVWMAILAMGYGGAFLLWPRGAWRILRGHWAIIRFWHRNWRCLGAHQVRQSPLYGDGRMRTGYYADESPRAYANFAKNVLHQNYFIVPVALAAFTGDLTGHPAGVFLLAWIVSVYAWGILIHCIRGLRGIGLGLQYFKYALAPSLMATAIVLHAPANWLVLGAVLGAVILTLRQYLLVARDMHTEAAGGSVASESSDLDRLLDRLRKDEGARIMALPVHLCDLIAYRTRRPVYWGTHSDVFDSRLEAFFPVLQRPLGEYAKDGELTHLILDQHYVTAKELHLRNVDHIFSQGRFRLYRLHAQSGRNPVKATAV